MSLARLARRLALVVGIALVVGVNQASAVELFRPHAQYNRNAIRPDVEFNAVFAAGARDLAELYKEQTSGGGTSHDRDCNIVENKGYDCGSFSDFVSAVRHGDYSVVGAYEDIIQNDPAHFPGTGTKPMGYVMFLVFTNDFQQFTSGYGVDWLMKLYGELGITPPVNLPDGMDGWTLSMWAARKPYEFKYIKRLVKDWGADRAVKDANGHDVLDHALYAAYASDHNHRWGRVLEDLSFLHNPKEYGPPNSFLSASNLQNAILHDDVRKVFYFASEAWDFSRPLPDGKTPISLAWDLGFMPTVSFLAAVSQTHEGNVGFDAFIRQIDSELPQAFMGASNYTRLGMAINQKPDGLIWSSGRDRVIPLAKKRH